MLKQQLLNVMNIQKILCETLKQQSLPVYMFHQKNFKSHCVCIHSITSQDLEYSQEIHRYESITVEIHIYDDIQLLQSTNNVIQLLRTLSSHSNIKNLLINTITHHEINNLVNKIEVKFTFIQKF